MSSYKYVAKDAKGNSLSGTLEAANRQEALKLLHGQDLLIISLDEAKAQPAGTRDFFKKPVKLDDLVVFSQQLATMVDAGITLVSSLDILGQQIENSTFKKIVLDIRNKVEAGSSLSDAMGKHYEDVFSELFVNMVRAGEASGMLDDILNRLAEYLYKMNALQRKIKSALVYPAVVTAIALCVTLFLLIRVIPVFKEIYAGFGTELPRPTQALIFVSDYLGQNFVLGTILVIFIAFAIKRYLRTEGGRLRFDRLLLGLPVFGILVKKVAVSKFSRTLATLVKSGVPILSALEIVGKTSGNRVVEKAVESVRVSVREGEDIAQPLAKAKIFPPMVVRMVSVGEKSGELEKMLTKIADFYEDQVDVAVNGLTSLMEPFIIVFLGLVIGTIVVCMFLPIFKITAMLGG
jgi:type IV pilus assembly protein PilC